MFYVDTVLKYFIKKDDKKHFEFYVKESIKRGYYNEVLTFIEKNQSYLKDFSDVQFEISILDSIIVKSSIYKNDVKRIKNNYYKKPLFSSWQRI